MHVNGWCRIRMKMSNDFRQRSNYVLLHCCCYCWCDIGSRVGTPEWTVYQRTARPASRDAAHSARVWGSSQNCSPNTSLNPKSSIFAAYNAGLCYESFKNYSDNSFMSIAGHRFHLSMGFLQRWRLLHTRRFGIVSWELCIWFALC